MPTLEQFMLRMFEEVVAKAHRDAENGDDEMLSVLLRRAMQMHKGAFRDSERVSPERIGENVHELLSAVRREAIATKDYQLLADVYGAVVRHRERITAVEPEQVQEAS